MTRALVVYGTTEGQTAKIAQHIADAGRRLGHTVDVLHGADLPPAFALAPYDVVVIGASVHEGRHQAYIRDFVQRHRVSLDAKPNAFFQVCLTSVSGDDRHRQQAQEVIDRFVADTGWVPRRTASFAGALRYTQYSWLKRMLLRAIARQEGGATDTSRDHEYTDWAQVTAFAEEVLGPAR